MRQRCRKDASLEERVNLHSIPVPEAGCLIWLGTTARGYGWMTWQGEKRLVHRLVWEHNNGPIPDGMRILHKCDTPSCVNIAHLSMGTAQANTADMILKGRGRRGPTKLSPSDVEAIRGSAEPRRILAERYNVHPTTIWQVQRNIIWGDGQP